MLPPSSSDIELMQSRLGMLEQQVAKLSARHVLFRSIFRVIVTVLLGVVALEVSGVYAATQGGQLLYELMDWSGNTAIPPLGTNVRWARKDPPSQPIGSTNQVLSIVEEATQMNSFSWPLYVQLSGTTNPSATQDTSQSVVVTARAYNRSTGSPWLAGFHSEVHHGLDNVTNQRLMANGTSIMFNGELSSYNRSGRTIGMNLQANGGGTTYVDDGINLQSTSTTTYWSNGVHFEGPFNIGINFDTARANMGIELRQNSMRMDAGQKIYLNGFNGTAFITYNASTQRVEIWNYGRVMASW